MRTTWATHRRLMVIIALIAATVGSAILVGCSKSGKSASSSGAVAGGVADFAGTAKVPGPAASSAASASSAAGAAPDAANAGTGDLTSDLNLGSTAQIKTAQLTLAAKDVSAAATGAIQVATGAGGGVSADVRTAATTGEPSSGSAQLTLKVPPDQLETTLTRLDALGTERERQTSSQDVTGQVADVTSRVASAQSSIAQLQALFSRATAVGDVVAIEAQLSQREADLEALQAQQRALSAQTSFATITMSIVALGAPVVTTKPADRGGFVGGLTDGWHAFTRALGWGLTGIGAVLPFAILIALLAWAAAAIRRRRVRPAAAAVTVSASGPGVLE